MGISILCRYMDQLIAAALEGVRMNWDRMHGNADGANVVAGDVYDL